MKRIVMLFAVVVLAACGGSSGSSAASVAQDAAHAQAEGRAGALYNLYTADMQARMSQADYVACVTAGGGTSQTVTTKVVEDIATTYTTTAGAQMPAHAITVDMTSKSNSSQKLTEQFWLAQVGGAWRVVHIVSSGVTEDKACMKRL